MYRQLIALRRTLPRGSPAETEYDELARWLIVRRADYELVCNFGSGPATIPCHGQTVELTAGGEASLRPGSIKISAMSGALIR